jgi:hypothetical protein
MTLAGLPGEQQVKEQRKGRHQWQPPGLSSENVGDWGAAS